MFTQEAILGFLLKCLWVACGFAGGYLFTWIAGVGFDKLVSKTPSPPWLHKWARRIGGALVALIVAFLVFPGGTGNGLGGGGGSGPEANPNGVTGPTAKDTAKTPSTEKPPERVSRDAVFVTVYAGKAVDLGTENFFTLSDRPTDKVDVAAVAKAVREKQKTESWVAIVYTLDATADTPEPTNGFRTLVREAKSLKVPPPMTPEEYDQARPKK